MQYFWRHLCFFWACWLSLVAFSHAEPLPLKHIRGEAIQGGLIIYQTDPHAEVFIDKEKIALSASGYFSVGFHRDDKAAVDIEVLLSEGRKKTFSLTPRQRRYAIERIDGLSRKMVTPDPDLLEQIKQDRSNVVKARSHISALEDAFTQALSWPATGRITGIYGSQRILNGQPRQPHYGIDIAVPEGWPITASADGIVTMAESLYFTGGTIIIDHGFGLNTTYSHLYEMKVKPHQKVKRGQVIATAGSTGRSTGPHLDWRVNLRSQRLDPMLLAEPADTPLPKARPQ